MQISALFGFLIFLPQKVVIGDSITEQQRVKNSEGIRFANSANPDQENSQFPEFQIEPSLFVVLK